MQIEQEPIVTVQLTGRMGYTTATRGKKTWRGALMLSGRMGEVTCNGEIVTGKVPDWFQRQLGRATAFMMRAYLPAEERQ